MFKVPQFKHDLNFLKYFKILSLLARFKKKIFYLDTHTCLKNLNHGDLLLTMSEKKN
jgi:hypothetical protein